MRHLSTGYLAKYRDVDDFARGTRLILNDESLRARLADESRRVAVTEYGLELQARRFVKLYEGLISNALHSHHV